MASRRPARPTAAASATSRAVAITASWLQARPLPRPGGDADKEQRGAVLIVAGSRELPGAAVLAATAALRAGCGKLMVATGDSVASLIAIALPEARVIALPETRSGGFAPAAARRIEAVAAKADAVLIGPGMMDDQAAAALALALLPAFTGVPLLLDASAMNAVRRMRRPFAQPVLMTPHAGEMAHLCGCDKEDIEADPLRAARAAAAQWNAVVALKGATTLVAGPQGDALRHSADVPGLATSGSGDTLAGIAAGLLARGMPIAEAMAWAIVLHARAGQELARRFGPTGYLARELAAEVPGLMRRLQKQQ